MKDLKAHNVIDVTIQLHDFKQIPKGHYNAHIIGYTTTRDVLVGVLVVNNNTVSIRNNSKLIPIYTYILIEHTKKDFEYAINKYNRK